MKIKTIATNRKDIVAAISEAAHVKAVYLGPPTFSYQIGEFTVDREGTVEVLNEKSGMDMKKILIDKGFAEPDIDCLEIKITIECHSGTSLKNLVYMLHSKQYLLNRSVGRTVFKISEDFIAKLSEREPESSGEFLQLLSEAGGNEVNEGIYFTDDAIVFDGFPMDTEGTKIKAYAELSALICSAALNQKRVSPRETIEENEKYYMRVWLVRLGLGGQGGKETRKVLLQNLKGHTAFRTEEEKERAREKAKDKTNSKKADSDSSID